MAGHLNSGVSIPASAVYNQAGIPMVSGAATNPKLTEQGFKTIFRIVGRDDQQGPAVAQYLNSLKVKKVAIADDATAYGEGLANEVEKTLKAAGVQVVAREKATDKTTDFKAILTKMKGKAPDAIFYGGMDATGGPMIKQARELGIKSVFSFGDGACTDEMVKLAGTAAEGLICSQAGLPASAASKEFNDAFKAKYGDVKQYAPFFYDAVGLMIAAMQKADSTDPAKYLPELQKISYNGATGKIEFDEKGDRKNAEITIFTLKDGKVEPIAVVQGGKSYPFDEFLKGIAAKAAAATPAPRAAPAAARRPRRRRRRSRRVALRQTAPRGAPFLFLQRPNAERARRAAVARCCPIGGQHGQCSRASTDRFRKRRDDAPACAALPTRLLMHALDIFLQQIINGLTLGSVYAIVALGYTMVYGIIQLINFAHGEVVMIGAMVAYSVIVALAGAGSRCPPVAIVLIGTLAAIPVCMAVGYTLERTAYRPLRNAPRLAPLITAIGLSIILQHLAMIVWSRNPLSYPQIIKTVSYHVTGTSDGATITNVQIAIIAGLGRPDGGFCCCSSTGRSSASRCARPRRIHRSPD